nr:hypothetical protein [Tanacetum cinerariifolium]
MILLHVCVCLGESNPYLCGAAPQAWCLQPCEGGIAFVCLLICDYNKLLDRGGYNGPIYWRGNTASYLQPWKVAYPFIPFCNLRPSFLCALDDAFAMADVSSFFDCLPIWASYFRLHMSDVFNRHGMIPDPDHRSDTRSMTRSNLPWQMCPPFLIVYLSESYSGQQENVGVSLGGDDENLCIDEGLGQCHVLEFGGWYG